MKPPPRFTVGQRVCVVQAFHDATGMEKEMIGRTGVVAEVDDIRLEDEARTRLQVNYEVRWDADGFVSYMHDEELEAV